MTQALDCLNKAIVDHMALEGTSSSVKDTKNKWYLAYEALHTEDTGMWRSYTCTITSGETGVSSYSFRSTRNEVLPADHAEGKAQTLEAPSDNFVDKLDALCDG